MKKILVIQPIHEAGIELLKNNQNYEFEIVENVNPEYLKKKIKDCDGVTIRTAKLTHYVIEVGVVCCCGCGMSYKPHPLY